METGSLHLTSTESHQLVSLKAFHSNHRVGLTAGMEVKNDSKNTSFPLEIIE